MGITGINNTVVTNTNPVFVKKESANSFEMDDFMKMMVAQLQNQDMNSSVDSSEYVNQMAQYSMIQAITDMTASMGDMMTLSTTNYGVSLIGKEVTLETNMGGGDSKPLTGVVEGVNFFGGDTQVKIDGKSYNLTQIMSVGNVSE